jgi:hypothetical protein
MEECVVCYNFLNEDTDMLMICRHPLCINCYQQMPNYYCPICRRIMISRRKEKLSIKMKLIYGIFFIVCGLAICNHMSLIISQCTH